MRVRLARRALSTAGSSELSASSGPVDVRQEQRQDVKRGSSADIADRVVHSTAPIVPHVSDEERGAWHATLGNYATRKNLHVALHSPPPAPPAHEPPANEPPTRDIPPTIEESRGPSALELDSVTLASGKQPRSPSIGSGPGV